MFSCNPVNTIIISPTKSGYFAKEIVRNAKGVKNVVESCIGKHTPQVAKRQFAKMGYKDIKIVPELVVVGNKLKPLFA